MSDPLHDYPSGEPGPDDDVMAEDADRREAGRAEQDRECMDCGGACSAYLGRLCLCCDRCLTDQGLAVVGP